MPAEDVKPLPSDLIRVGEVARLLRVSRQRANKLSCEQECRRRVRAQLCEPLPASIILWSTRTLRTRRAGRRRRRISRVDRHVRLRTERSLRPSR